MQSIVVRGMICALGLLVATAVAAQEKSKVVAVNYPLQYFAQRVLGDAAQVEFLVPEDVDPSFWRPSIADISAIQSADLILLNGAGFATWVDRVSLPRSRVVNTSAAFEDQFIVTETITHSHGDGGEHAHDGLASYLWLDPRLAIAQAEAIAQAAIQRDLAPADAIEGRLEDLRADLEELEQQAQSALSGASNAVLIATHPRYQYIGRSYDLTINALEWEAGAAPSQDQLADLNALKEETNASVLIWEAAPPAAALGAVERLGMKNTVFPTLAHPPAEGDFIAAYKKALEALAAALKDASN